MHLIVEFWGEVMPRLQTSVQGACHVVAGIANRFELADFAHHLANLRLGNVTQMVVAHLFQETGNFYFYLVGDILLMGYLTE